jgi:hypothetical protein
LKIAVVGSRGFVSVEHLPEVGQRIRYVTKTARHGRGLEREEREGVVICIWENVGGATSIGHRHMYSILAIHGRRLMTRPADAK